MSTGDLKGNLCRLQSELKHVRYPKDLDFSSLARGSPTEFLPILHYVMCDFSRPFAELILKNNIDLMGKTDKKFVESVYKVLRDVFNYKPSITNVQFFSKGFAEHKILFVIDVVSMVKEKHRRLRKTSGAPCKDTTKMSKKQSSQPDVVAMDETDNKLIPEIFDTVDGPELFRPSLNSTAGVSSPVPESQSITDTSVQIVVVGQSASEPCVLSTPSSDTAALLISEKIDDIVTPRRRRQHATRGGHDAGYNTAEASPTSDAVVYDSELKTHPVIRELAVIVADLMNQVRTLEERLESVILDSKKREQNMNAKLILLENKCCIMEGKLQQQMPFYVQCKSPIQGTPTGTKFEQHRVRNHHGEGDAEVDEGGSEAEDVEDEACSEKDGEEDEDEGVINPLETVEEEVWSRDAMLPLVIDEGRDGGHNTEDKRPEDEVGVVIVATEEIPLEADSLQKQAERIQTMLTNAEQMLTTGSSLEC